MINFNLNATNFYSYMREIASKHKLIGKDSEEKNRKHFFIGELEDFYKGLNSVVEFPALVVEGFKLNLSDEEQSTKYRESAFTVVFDYKDHDNYEQQTTCFSNSEDIGLEILRKMNEDACETICPIGISDISGVQIINTKDKYAGIRFSFTLFNANVTEINNLIWE